MEKIIIFGTGKYFQERKKLLDNNEYEIKEYWDNDPKKWGKYIDGKMVVKPRKAFNRHKIIITCNSYDEVYNQLVNELEINPEIIEGYWWFEKIKLIKRYSKSDDKDIQTILNYIKNNELAYINYPWVEKYNCDIEVYWDCEYKLYYVICENKRMYMKRSLKNKNEVRNYYRSLLIEQDNKSPHYYYSADDYDNKVILDVGAAEGNYTLHVIDKIKLAVILEVDEEWIEALKITFMDYKNKVMILQKYVGISDDKGNISLATLIEQYKNETPMIVKMDIEGAEEMVLSAAEPVLERSHNIEFVICTYHHTEAERFITQLFKKNGYTIRCNEGYMYFSVLYDQYCVQFKDIKNEVDLRRGVLFAEK